MIVQYDQRDFEFAKKYNLEITRVISDGKDTNLNEAFTGNGKIINSESLNGLNISEAKIKLLILLKKKNRRKKTLFRLKDWGISRQRYWVVLYLLFILKMVLLCQLTKNELPIRLQEDIDLEVPKIL